MADEFQLGSGNWWDSTRIESGSSSSPSSAAAELNTRTTSTTASVGSYGWLTQVVDMEVGGGGSVLEEATPHDHGILTDNSNLQMMGLGLSSQGMDQWNQPLSLMRSEKGDESSFGRMHDGGDDDELRCSNSSIITIRNFEQEQYWSTRSHHHMHSAARRNCEEEEEEEESNPGGLFSLHQPHLITSSHHRILNPSGHDTSPNVVFTCPMNSSIHDYPNNNPPSSTTSIKLQGLLGSNNWSQQQSTINNYSSYGIINPPSSSSSSSGVGAGTGTGDNHHHQPLILHPNSSWSKLPAQNQLQFSNNSDPFWNASTAAAAAAAAASSNLLPNSLQMQLPSPTFNEKPKNISRDLITVGKKSDSSSEPSTKRPRNETPSPLPPFKVRKEKMGDRITALQQLVSPFGKTDTASVLSEAIEYINFLHEQVGALSNPYIKSGAPIQQQDCDKPKANPEREEQDLRSRGLCLVPVSSTFPVTHETTVDFWNPTFGGTFR